MPNILGIILQRVLVLHSRPSRWEQDNSKFSSPTSAVSATYCANCLRLHGKYEAEFDT